MAAASAGTLQSVSAVVSGSVQPQSAANTVVGHHHYHLNNHHNQLTASVQQQQQQLQLQQQHLQQVTQRNILQSQQLHPNLATSSQLSSEGFATVGTGMNRSVVVGGGGGGGLTKSSASGGGGGGGDNGNGDLIIGTNAMLQRPPQTINAANLAPGWRRLISNNEVIYVSPTGASLRTHGQIKDYLLSPGTCKCGLPCPLRPEYFFDFNSQVPNTPLQIPLENGLPARSSLACRHEKKFFESQQNFMHKDAKRRKLNELSSSSTAVNVKLSTSPIPQCNSVTVYSGNVMQTSQLIGNNTRMQMMTQNVPNVGQQSQMPSNIAFQIQAPNKHQQQQQLLIDNPSIKPENEKQIGSVTLSKTPPWRKNSILQQQNSQHVVQQSSNQNNQIYASGNERVPPLPQAHLCQQSSIVSQQSQQQHHQQQQQQQQQQTQQHSGQIQTSWQEQCQTRFLKTRGSTITKKKPNFKDDPTGYLDHQTAILHSSIQNIVHSPDLNDAPVVENDGVSGRVGVPGGPKSNKNENIMSVIQQNQNVYPQNIEIKQESIKNESNGLKQLSSSSGNNATNRLYRNSGQTTYEQLNEDEVNIKQETIEMLQNPTEQNHFVQNSNFIYANQQSRMMAAPSQLIDSTVTVGKQPTASSQNQFIRNPQQTYQSTYDNQQHQQSICRTVNMVQATTTTIGGQTVTHFPNGMVQVEQNCDSMIPLKPQQQIQLRQQIQQHNLLYRQNQQIQQKSIGKNYINNNSSNNNNSSSGNRNNNNNNNNNNGSDYNEPKLQSSSSSSGHHILVPASQESPVSSSTTFSRSTPERRKNNTPENSKGPPQVGAISTSNESPSPVDSPESSNSSMKTTITATSPSPNPCNTIVNPIRIHLHQQQGQFATSQTSARNTITSVTAGKTITATTTALNDKTINIVEPEYQQQHQGSSSATATKLTQNNIIPVSTTNLSSLQLHSVVREPGNQLIMTSTGQLIVMPTQSHTNKSPSNQVIINSNLSPTNSNIILNNHQHHHHQQQNVVLNQSQPHHHQQNAVVNNSHHMIGNNVDVMNHHHHQQNHHQSNTIQLQNHHHHHSNNSLVIQNSSIVQTATGQQQIIQQSPANNLNSNFQIVNSSNGMPPVILNNSNLIQSNGQNIITANAANIIQNPNGSSLITANGKVISNNGNILNNQNTIISNSGNIISSNNGGIIGQQTVVLNTLPNGYVIQPNFATVDGQVVGQIVNQDNGQSTTATFLQQHQQRPQQIILTSPDSKRKGKKRKSSVSSSPSTPSSLSPQQSPTTIQQQASGNMSAQTSGQQTPQSTMVLTAPQYPTQGFQISPGIQGIAVMNKNTQNHGGPHQQQILFQNGQIIQPMNLIGQQLLVPAGLVVAPETTTLLQIQNVAPCGSIITPQGVVLRAPSPQNKNFLSPNGSGQQFIVSGNSQMSPLGQIYGTPVGLVVPQSNSSAAAAAAATFVQQNTTIVQQQTTMMSNNNTNNSNNNGSSINDNSSEQSQSHQVSASPPDTTTHSPRSPERPPSERSGGSDMVQCVSSSEPDSVVSPTAVTADSAQSPDCDRSSISYQSNNIFKQSDGKMRRVQTPPLFSNSLVQEVGNQMRPDSHESPTNSPPASATSTTSNSNATSTLPGNGTNLSSVGGIIGCGGGGTATGTTTIGQLQQSFCIGELVWGAARGHPAWPGKVVNPPDNICTPSDSTWVQWFGGRPNVELVAINSLKSLSEGLEAHHKAQKDTRKSRKLNSQLERAIQEAMAELDRISMVSQTSSTSMPASATSPTTTTIPITSKNKSRGRGGQSGSTTVGHHRTKPIKIAPAPPCPTLPQHQQQLRQTIGISQVTHHPQHNSSQQQQQTTVPSITQTK